MQTVFLTAELEELPQPYAKLIRYRLGNETRLGLGQEDQLLRQAFLGQNTLIIGL